MGWIKLYREIKDHWIWEDPRKLKWWVDILINVNHEDKKVGIGFKVFDCKRGQSVKSLKTWGDRWDVSKTVVKNFFTMLENDNMITTENLTVTTRLTVCNYELYQGQQNGNETGTKRERPRKKTQQSPNKNIEELKEVYREQIKLSNDDKNYISFCKFLFGENDYDRPLTELLFLTEQMKWEHFQVIQHKIELMREKKGYTGTLKQKILGYVNGGYKKSKFFGTMDTWITGDANKLNIELPDNDAIRKALRK